jgi:hypothetical protein
MKRFFLFAFSISIFLLPVKQVSAQTDSVIRQERYQVAVFVPLYLDSAFSYAGDYKYGKTFPKFLSPGLEFYEGVQLAIDSMNKTGAALDVYIYDTRSRSNPITRIVQSGEFSTIDLIIGHVTNAEVRFLAEIARNKNIPFVNANIPNAAGITNNPSLVILNSTLKTHCEAIYRFLQRNYATSPAVVFTRRGAQENILKTYFSDIEKNTSSFSLKLKFVTLNDNFSPSQLLPYLDSNRLTMCIAGSLDESFAKQLSRQLAGLNATYPVQLIGMPTWDVIKDFEKSDYKGLEIYYTTPFYHPKTDKVSVAITNHFRTNLYSRPTDMVFRGYESMMRFGKLLMEHGPNLNSSIGEKKYKVFTDYDIQPVFLNRDTLTLDYFENRKLYFVKQESGVIKGIY